MTEISINFMLMNVLINTIGIFTWVIIGFILLITLLYVTRSCREIGFEFKSSNKNFIDFVLMSKRKVFGVLLMLGLLIWVSTIAITYQPRVVTTTTNTYLEHTLQNVKKYKQVEIPPASADTKRPTYDSLVDVIRDENERIKNMK
jgi:hypothetical protein